MATPHKAWTADGLKPADHDFARNAVVNATRDYVGQMAPLLKGAGLGDTYPILIWRDRDGFLKACACTDERSYHFIRSDLGVEGEGAKLVDKLRSAISGATSNAAPASKPAPAAAAPTATPPPATMAPATSAAAAGSPPATAPQTQPQAANDATAPKASEAPRTAQGNFIARAPRRHSNPRAVFY
jgi:hypothetical protein